MTEQPIEKNFIASFTIPDGDRYPFEYIKENLIREASEKIFRQMIDSGKHHVIKIEMGSRPTWKYNSRATEYFLVARLSIAQEREYSFAPHIIMMERPIEFLDAVGAPVKIDRICLGCGNKLGFDRRGGCAACGTPNGGYK